MSKIKREKFLAIQTKTGKAKVGRKLLKVGRKLEKVGRKLSLLCVTVQ